MSDDSPIGMLFLVIFYCWLSVWLIKTLLRGLIWLLSHSEENRPYKKPTSQLIEFKYVYIVHSRVPKMGSYREEININMYGYWWDKKRLEKRVRTIQRISLIHEGMDRYTLTIHLPYGERRLYTYSDLNESMEDEMDQLQLKGEIGASVYKYVSVNNCDPDEAP